jgi:hypothetical protein
MFRERIAHWTRILDILPVTIKSIAVLSKLKIASRSAGTYRSDMTVVQIERDARREMAMAYAQMSRLNR